MTNGTDRTGMRCAKGYDPEPLDVPPLCKSQSQPIAMVRWLVTKYMWPQSITWIALAALVAAHPQAAEEPIQV